jgi:hypothetical protein
MWTLLALACVDADPTAPYAVPAGVTASRSDPDAAADVWPDDGLTVADPTTATGRRLFLREGARAELAALLPEGFDLLDALQDLDGFGVNASIFMRFTAPIDPATLAASVHLVALPSGERLDWEASLTDDGATLLVQPLSSLAEASRYALLVDDDLRDAAGDPAWAAPRVYALAHGQAPTDADAWAVPAWTAAVRAAGLGADEVVAGTTFLTQTITAQDDAAVAVLRSAPPTLTLGACQPDEAMRRCDLTLEVGDLLGPDLTLGADEAPTVQRRYTLQLPVWLPAEGPGPFPVVLHGHGLGGTRFESRNTARQLTPLGVAVAGVDAPRHGDHPTATSSGDLFPILDFFGVDLFGGALVARVLRDQFRQSAWDRVQVAAALALAPDVDGDAAPDLDGRVWYSGHSLGGVVGPQLLALSPDIGGAFLSVPGGKVASIVHRSGTFAPLVGVMAPPGTSDGQLDRFFPLLQTAIDRGDPASWAARAAIGRDIVATQVIDDAIIPNETTRHLVRALGLEHAGAVLQPIDGLPRYTGGYPVVANVGGHTAALWQYTDGHFDGAPSAVDHSTVWDADEHRAQLRAFFTALRDDGAGALIDPTAP